MNESETRAEQIDPALKLAGWGVVSESRIKREYSITLGRIEGHGKRGKALTADYVLVYRNRKLAVLEAKAIDKALTEGVAQAKDYATKLSIRFAYSSNGKGIYAIDMESGKEEEIPSFPTPEELWTRTFSKDDQWRDRFNAVPYEDKGGSHAGRYYQDISVERVVDAIAQNKQRILLTLATGTGKTFIAFQIIWKLFHSRWNLSREPSRRPRVLFLADRNTLANQAYNAFSAFPEDALVRIDPDEIRKKKGVPKNGSIFFTIFQTFMTGTKDGEAAPYFGEYPSDFFDFIVIDECHRGGSKDESNWRGILEYFSPAVQLGLTATPKRKDNADTYKYFGEPVFVYSLRDGINDGFLTPFKVVQIQTTLDEYVYTKDDRVMEGEVEEGRRYIEKDFNRSIEIEERERKRVELFMGMMNQNEKTIVFCASQGHALLIRDLVNQTKKIHDPNYCQRVTANDGALGEQHLEDFKDNEKTIPTVLTTSQKLSTGVDARNVRNIVLMRPVNSMIEFKQIIGRGTRLYEGKHYFTIYDFVKAHHLFSDPEWDGDPAEPEEKNKVCEFCKVTPCTCEEAEQKPCSVCGTSPCSCEMEQCERCGKSPCICARRTKVKLADGKERTIQHMTCTSFWHSSGRPMSSQEFLDLLFGQIPEFFKNEEELRQLWSEPDTRTKLLDGLAEKGFGSEQLGEMQKIINAEKSDLFDVLAYVAYALPPLTREDRASKAKVVLPDHFNSKQQVFLDFVLNQYVQVGVQELAKEKLKDLLKLKYSAISDALADLGSAPEIGMMFGGFQRFLY